MTERGSRMHAMEDPRADGVLPLGTMHAMEDPRAGDVLPLGYAATADSRCEIAYDVSESKGDEAVGGRLGIHAEESATESTLSKADTHIYTSPFRTSTRTSMTHSETSGDSVAKGDSVGKSAANPMPPMLRAKTGLEEAVLILPVLPGMVAGGNARSYKCKVEFQADINNESHAKNFDAHQSRDLILVEQHQGQAASSADQSNVVEEYEFVTPDASEFVTQDASGPSSGDSEDEDPIVPQEHTKFNRRRSVLLSAIEMTGAVGNRPTSILITEKKRLERNNRPKAVTELRRVHFRVPKAKRSWRLLGPVDSSVAAVQYWRMALLLPVAWELWAFPFRLAYCDIERNQAMFVYNIDIIGDVWFGIAMIGYLCERARCQSCLLWCFVLFVMRSW